MNKAIQKLDTSKFTYHKLTVEESVAQLKTDLKQGLTDAEARKRLQDHGPNELEAEEAESIWEKILEQFKDLLV